MSKYNQTSGISEDLVENYNECVELIASLTCCICLEIVKNPYECENCESLYCFECWDMMKVSGKNCVYACTSPIIKAKKFIFDMLSKIRFHCEDCKKHNIPYKTYLRHIQICQLNQKYKNIEETENILKECRNKVEEISKEIEREKRPKTILDSNDEFLNLLKNKDKLRKKYLTNLLSATQKKELYNSIIDGDNKNFHNLVSARNYETILEEISAAGYYWTSLHYAMHYGNMSIIKYILGYYDKTKKLDEVMRLESNDGRCPLIALMKSNSINSAKKKVYLEAIFNNFKFSITKEVRKELVNRGFDEIRIKYGIKVI